MSYTLNYADKAEKFDEVVETDGAFPPLSRRDSDFPVFKVKYVHALTGLSCAACPLRRCRPADVIIVSLLTFPAAPIGFARTVVPEIKLIE